MAIFALHSEYITLSKGTGVRGKCKYPRPRNHREQPPYMSACIRIISGGVERGLKSKAVTRGCALLITA